MPIQDDNPYAALIPKREESATAVTGTPTPGEKNPYLDLVPKQAAPLRDVSFAGAKAEASRRGRNPVVDKMEDELRAAHGRVDRWADRNIAGTNKKSDHATGDALDVFDVKNAQSIIGKALANPAVKYVIYNRRIWNRSTGTWKPYTGRNPHTDHVHVSFDHQGTPIAEAGSAKSPADVAPLDSVTMLQKEHEELSTKLKHTSTELESLNKQVEVETKALERDWQGYHQFAGAKNASLASKAAAIDKALADGKRELEELRTSTDWRDADANARFEAKRQEYNALVTSSQEAHAAEAAQVQAELNAKYQRLTGRTESHNKARSGLASRIGEFTVTQERAKVVVDELNKVNRPAQELLKIKKSFETYAANRWKKVMPQEKHEMAETARKQNVPLGKNVDLSLKHLFVERLKREWVESGGEDVAKALNLRKIDKEDMAWIEEATPPNTLKMLRDFTNFVVELPRETVRGASSGISRMLGNGDIDPKVYIEDIPSRVSNHIADVVPYLTPGAGQALMVAQVGNITSKLALKEATPKDVWNSINPLASDLAPEERIIRTAFLVGMGLHAKGRVSDAMLARSVKKALPELRPEQVHEVIGTYKAEMAKQGIDIDGNIRTSVTRERIKGSITNLYESVSGKLNQAVKKQIGTDVQNVRAEIVDKVSSMGQGKVGDFGKVGNKRAYIAEDGRAVLVDDLGNIIRGKRLDETRFIPDKAEMPALSENPAVGIEGRMKSLETEGTPEPPVKPSDAPGEPKVEAQPAPGTVAPGKGKAAPAPTAERGATTEVKTETVGEAPRDVAVEAELRERLDVVQGNAQPTKPTKTAGATPRWFVAPTDAPQPGSVVSDKDLKKFIPSWKDVSGEEIEVVTKLGADRVPYLDSRAKDLGFKLGRAEFRTTGPNGEEVAVPHFAIRVPDRGWVYVGSEVDENGLPGTQAVVNFEEHVDQYAERDRLRKLSDKELIGYDSLSLTREASDAGMTQKELSELLAKKNEREDARNRADEANEPLRQRTEAMLRDRMPTQSPSARTKVAGLIVEAITTGEYSDVVHPDNKNSRAIFEELTGVKLPSGAAATKAIFQGKPFALSVDGKAHEAATSTKNDLAHPSDEQKEAGNYKKGHVKVSGLDIAIENPAGSKRRAEWPALKSHYGYLKGTIGYDKDHLDVFIKPGTSLDWSGEVWVVNQLDKNGKFDEHKVMIGFGSFKEAEQAYLENYTPGQRDNVDSLVPMSMDEFKRWAFNTTKSGSSPRDGKLNTERIHNLIHDKPTPAHPSKKFEIGESVTIGGMDHEIVAIRTVNGTEKFYKLESANGEAEFAEADLLKAIEAKLHDPVVVVGVGHNAKTAGPIEKGDTILLEGKEWNVREADSEGASVWPRVYTGVPIGRRMSKAELSRHGFFLPTGKAQGVDEDFERQMDEAEARVKAQKEAASQSTTSVPQPKLETLKEGKIITFEGKQMMVEIVSADGAQLSLPGGTPRRIGRHQLEAQGYTSPKWNRKPKTAPAPKVQSTPTGTQKSAEVDRDTTGRIVAAASKAGVVGAENDIAGIVELFSDGPSFALAPGASEPFDDALYAKAKPKFDSVFAAFEKSGKTMGDFLEFWFVQADNLDINIRPYLRRWNAERKDNGAGVSDASSTGTIRGAGQNLHEGEPSGDVQAASGSGHAGSNTLGNGETGGRHDGTHAGPGSGLQPGVRGSEQAPVSTSGGSGNGTSSGSTRKSRNYKVTLPEEMGETTLSQKKADLIAAITTLKAIEARNKPATKEELAILARFPGWGWLGNTLHPTNSPDPALRDQLRSLLTKAEMEISASSSSGSAEESMLTSHYTSGMIIEEMWSAAKRLGFKGGNALENSAGKGLFLGMAPNLKIDWTAVEMDPITGRILAQLYPESDVRIAPFQKANVPRDAYELVIGNFPFGGNDSKIIDSEITKKYGSHVADRIHNYFFVRSLESLKPGGVLIAVTSKGAMDANDTAAVEARVAMARQADLVGAVRLPNTSFSKNAGTEVTTDILIFRKRLEGETPSGEAFLNTAPIVTREGANMLVNEYFVNHPDMVLGGHSNQGKMYGKSEGKQYTLHFPNTVDFARVMGKDFKKLADLKAEVTSLKAKRDKATPYSPERRQLDRELTEAETKLEAMEQPYAEALRDREAAMRTLIQKALTRLPKNILGATEGRVKALSDAGPQPPAGVKTGGMFKVGEEWYAATSPVTSERLVLSKTELSIAELFLPLRDALLNLLNTQAGVEDNAVLVPLQAELKRAYEAFVKKNGKLHDQTARRLLSRDPDGPLVLSLETVKKVGQKYEHKGLADVFTKRVIRYSRNIDTADGPEDALVASLTNVGKVSMAEMVRLTGMSEEDLATALEGLIFEDIATGEWVTADEYGSGNVVVKLKAAKEKAKEDPAYQANVKFLESRQPTRVEIYSIKAPLGSPWVDVESYKAFARELFGRPVKITKIAQTGDFVVDAEFSHALDSEGMRAIDIFAKVLSGSQITVWAKDEDGKPYVDEALTNAARQRATELDERWERYMRTHEEISTQVEDAYNEFINVYALREFDGSHLTLPGSTLAIGGREFKPYDHQLNGIWRIMQRNAVMLAHGVGSGKTITIAGAAMELRRTGLRNKCCILAFNGTEGQYQETFRSMYPNSKVLVIEASALDKDRRRATLAKIATGNWDAVVIPHSVFARIPPSPELVERYYQLQIDNMMEALLEAGGSESDLTSKSLRGRDATIKQIVRNIKTIIQRLEAKRETLAKNTDPGPYWEHMGFDQVFVDEAHEYKNLPYGSQRPGLGSPGSQRAADLEMKTMHTFAQKGGVVLASGTPVANSISEAFGIFRYLVPGALSDMGLKSFDNWANSYALAESKMERTVAGTFKDKIRLRTFFNLPELQKMVREVSDVVHTSDLARDGKIDLPKLTDADGNITGKSIVQESKPNAHQKRYFKILKQRADAIATRQGPPQKGDDILLSVSTDGRKSSLDIRLIDERAMDDPGSKVNQCVDNLARIYHTPEYAKEKATQIVFLDMGTPKNTAKPKPELVFRKLDDMDAVNKAVAKLDEENYEPIITQNDDGTYDVEPNLEAEFNLYDDIKKKLIRKGVPAGEIAFMHDAPKKDQKMALMEKVNTGEVRIILTSTAKGGVGVNVQKRLIASHHLDPTWRPCDMEQRIGRIVRQGNMWKGVQDYQYVNVGTFDAFMWNKLAQKQAFITQFWRGDFDTREMEDISGDATFDPAVFDAIAQGNPQILEYQQLLSDVRQAEMGLRSHENEQIKLQRDIKRYQEEIPEAKALLAQFEAVAKYAEANLSEDFEMTVSGNRFKERKAAGAALIAAIKRAAGIDGETKIGEFAGFDIRAGVPENSKLFSVWLATDKFTIGSGKYRSGHSAVENVVGLEPEDVLSYEVPTVGRVERLVASAHEFALAKAHLVNTLEEKLESAKREVGRPWTKQEQYDAMKLRLKELDETIGAALRSGRLGQWGEAEADAEVGETAFSVDPNPEGATATPAMSEGQVWISKADASQWELFGESKETGEVDKWLLRSFHGLERWLPKTELAEKYKFGGYRNYQDEEGPNAAMAPSAPPGTAPRAAPKTPAVRTAPAPSATALAQPKGSWAEFRRMMLSNFTPEALSIDAMRTGLDIREIKADSTLQLNRAEHLLDEARRWFDSKPKELGWQVIDDIETGTASANPEAAKFAKIMRGLLDLWRAEIQKHGKLEDYIENYFPHIWKDPDKAMAWVLGLGKRPLEGSKAFLKHRTVPTVKAGMAAGLEPAVDNPVDLVLLKLQEMQRYMAAQHVMERLKADGRIKFLPAHDQMPEGWSKIDDGMFTVYGPPVVPIKITYDEKLYSSLVDFAAAIGSNVVRAQNIPGMPSAFGVETKTGIILKPGASDFVLAHEIGHAIDRKAKLKYKLFQSSPKAAKIKEQLEALAALRYEGFEVPESYKRYVTKQTELVANMIHAYIHAPELLRHIAPTALREFETIVNATPSIEGIRDVKPGLVLGVREELVPVAGLRIMGTYIAPAEVAALVNNHLSPGMRGSSNAIVRTFFTRLRGVNNIMNQVQLGLSFFHLFDVAIHAMSSEVALAITKTARRDVRGLFHLPHSLIAGVTYAYEGKKIYKAYMEGTGLSPEMRAAVRAIVLGGGGAKMDAIYATNARRTLRRAIRDVLHGEGKERIAGAGTAAMRIPQAILEAFASLTMEKFVPYVKLAAFVRIFQTDLQAIGTTSDMDAVKATAARAWDTVDDRMGELRYDNIFWNQTCKDAMFLLVRSFGWRLGNQRILLGAAKDTAGGIARKMGAGGRGAGGDGNPDGGVGAFGYTDVGAPAGITPRQAFLVASFLMGAVINSVLMYLMTGERPKRLRDLVFPPTGRKNADGTDERMKLPTYEAGHFELMDAIRREGAGGFWQEWYEQNFTRGQSPLLSAFALAKDNRTFDGLEVYNPEDPAYKQGLQVLAQIAKDMAPISAQGFEQNPGDPTWMKAAGFVGLNHAPLRVQRSDALLLAKELRAEHMGERPRTQEEIDKSKASREMVRLLRNGKFKEADAWAAKHKLETEDVNRAFERADTPEIVTSVKGLTLPEAEKVWKVATKQERELLEPVMEAKRARANGEEPKAARRPKRMNVPRFDKSIR